MPDKKISIELSEDNRTIHLLGDASTLSSSRLRNSLRRIAKQEGAIYDKFSSTLHLKEDNPAAVIRKLYAALKHNGLSANSNSEANSAISIALAEEKAFEDFSAKARDIRNNKCNVEDFRHFKEVLERRLPHRTLYPLQMLSAYHLAYSQNGCNFSVPGAGKTSIVYGAYSYLKSLPKADIKRVDRLVIIGPLSSFTPWESEFAECFGQKPSSIRLDGNSSKISKQEYLRYEEPKEITLLTYQGLDGIIGDLISYMKRNKVMLVLDEAHRIKNTEEGVWANNALSIAPYAKSRIILTGTPATNGYNELYNIFNFIWPNRNIMKLDLGQLKQLTRTRQKDRIERLLNYIEPYYLKIRKRDLNLPKADNKTLQLVPLSSRHKEIYDDIAQYYVEKLAPTENSWVSDGGTLLTKMIRLSQAATDPRIFLDLSQIPDYDLDLPRSIIEKIESFNKAEIPGKFIAAYKIIKEAVENNEKIIVWMHFVSTLKSMKAFLNSKGIEAEMLFGEIPTERTNQGDDQNELTRETIINDFNDPASPLKVIIANPAAVAESISLHHACHKAIYVERGFNAVQYLQSKDRIHRYGLKPDVVTTYYRLGAEGTIDIDIDKKLDEKEELLISITESSDIPLFDNAEFEISPNEFKEILRKYVQRTNRI